MDMKYGSTEEFLAARNAALISGDVEQLRRHLINAGEEGAALVNTRVLEISLHKSRVHWRDCPAELLKESVRWLDEHHFSLDF